MQDRAVADSPCRHSVETKPGYITACVLLKQKGTWKNIIVGGDWGGCCFRMGEYPIFSSSDWC